MSPVQSLIAMSGGAKIHADDLLGFLVMSTVPDRMVEYQGIVREWAREGLDTDVMPAPGKPVDIFQLACAAVATKRTRGAAEVILAERAASDGCTYQITRSVRDNDNRVVDHPKAMTFNFDPQNEILRVQRREEYDALKAIERRVRENYKTFKTQIPGSKVRTGVRETVVGKLGGTNYMGKGVYLVPRSGLGTLEAIGRVLDKTYGRDSHVSLIPMINTKSNRDDLSRFHADDIKERAESLMGTIATKLKAGGTVRSDMLANVLKTNRDLKAQRDQILELVGRETAEVEAELDIVGKQIDKLMELAGRPEEVTV